MPGKTCVSALAGLGLAWLLCAAALALPHQARAASGGAGARVPAPAFPSKGPYRYERGWYHKVGFGETLPVIANRYGVELSYLASVNGLTSKSSVASGRYLYIPPNSGYFHKVRAGETLPALARRFHLEESTLREVNQIAAGARIKTGDLLIIPSRLTPAPAPPSSAAASQSGARTSAGSSSSSTASSRVNPTRREVAKASTTRTEPGSTPAPKKPVKSRESGEPTAAVSAGKSAAPKSGSGFGEARSTTAEERAAALRSEPPDTHPETDLPDNPEPVRTPPPRTTPRPAREHVDDSAAFAPAPDPTPAPKRQEVAQVREKPRRTPAPEPEPTPPPAKASSGGMGGPGSAAAPPPPPAPTPAPRVRRNGNGAPAFMWPVEGKVVKGWSDPLHKGVAIAAPAGTIIRAAADGTVMYSGDEIPGYGRMAIIDHGNGWATCYAHAASLAVRTDQRVKAGDPVAKVGTTGGGEIKVPHCHFQIRLNREAVNPLPLLP